MKISVLIPTYNAKKFISDLFTKLNEQVLPDHVEKEIIIVDSSSTDGTVETINELFPNVKTYVIENKTFDHGGTRNLLASYATGDYYLFMTQDAIPADNNLFHSLLKNFEEEKVKIAYARQIPKNDANPLEQFARGFNYPDKKIIKDQSQIEALGIKTFFNSNVCSMYDARLFSGELGAGFPEKLILNEDMIMSYEVIKKGYAVVYDNHAIVYHSHNYNLVQQFKRYFDIGMAFHQSSYILKDVSNEKEGMKMVLELQKYLLQKKQYRFMPYSIFETASKYIGYSLGKKHDMFSYKVKKKLSAYMK